MTSSQNAPYYEAIRSIATGSAPRAGDRVFRVLRVVARKVCNLQITTGDLSWAGLSALQWRVWVEEYAGAQPPLETLRSAFLRLCEKIGVLDEGLEELNRRLAEILL